MRFVLTLTLLLAGILMVTLVFSGCNSDTAKDPQQTEQTSEAQPAIPDEMSGIAKLPVAEQKAALEQEICPVSDKKLGSMGTPIKVAVDSQDVFVCCDVCVGMLEENPGEYLAKRKKE